MNSVGLVTMFLGVLVIAVRGPLLIAPGATIRQFHALTATKTRIRGLGVALATMAMLVLWGGSSEEGALASFLLIVGCFLLFVAVPWLLLFPQTYKDLVDAFVPENTLGNLVVWRLLGVVGVCFGGLIFYVGLHH